MYWVSSKEFTIVGYKWNPSAECSGALRMTWIVDLQRSLQTGRMELSYFSIVRLVHSQLGRSKKLRIWALEYIRKDICHTLVAISNDVYYGLRGGLLAWHQTVCQSVVQAQSSTMVSAFPYEC